MDTHSEGSDSSIDGSIHVLLSKSSKPQLRTQNAQVDDYLPTISKINAFLSSTGHHDLFEITVDHIEESTRMVSTLLVDTWAQSVFIALIDFFQTNSVDSQRNIVNHDALDIQIHELQSKLFESEHKLRKMESDKSRAEEESDVILKKMKEVENENQRIKKSSDYQIQEGERRVRQRDLEIERYRLKLQQLATKDKSVDGKRKSALLMFKKGEIKVDPSTTLSPGSSKTSGAKNSSFSVVDVIEALESQRDALERRNAEMQSQIDSLTSALRDQANGSSQQSKRFIGKGLDTVSSDTEPDATQIETIAEIYAKLQAQKNRISQLEHRCEAHKIQNEELEGIVGQMRTRASELREEIENLRLELGNRPTMRQWSQKQREVQDMEDKVHDLVMMRGEVEEIKAWRKHLSTQDRIHADKRNYELGLWLLDSLPKTVMKEVLQGCCRELDISEVTDLQPTLSKLKAVVKAVPRMESFISAVCAYLFQRDEVVRSQMEASDKQPTLEDVLPTLKRWWKSVQRCEELEEFLDKILQELYRRELLLARQRRPHATVAQLAFAGDRSSRKQQQSSDVAGEDDEDGEDVDVGRGWDYEGRLLWAQRDRTHAVEVIRDMCDFQVAVMKHSHSFQAGEKFIQERPEELTSRIIKHVQYLFEITSLEGLLPRLNQIYVFTEEMKNFLSATRELMGMARGTPDKRLMAEIQRVVSQSSVGSS